MFAVATETGHLSPWRVGGQAAPVTPRHIGTHPVRAGSSRAVVAVAQHELVGARGRLDQRPSRSVGHVSRVTGTAAPDVISHSSR
jgi:hypothetical protein